MYIYIYYTLSIYIIIIINIINSIVISIISIVRNYWTKRSALLHRTRLIPHTTSLLNKFGPV